MTGRQRPRAPSEGSARGASKPVRRSRIEACYRRLRKGLLRRAKWKHGLSEEDASDVVQQAFIVALGKMGSVVNTQAWLERVVDGLAVNLRRTGARRAKLLAFWDPVVREIEEDEEVN